MSDLFPDLAEHKSPRLLWMEENGISMVFSDGLSREEKPWSAIRGKMDSLDEIAARELEGNVGYGETEEQALLDLIAQGNVKHWNL